jgi:Ca-activated chloride channel family protein
MKAPGDAGRYVVRYVLEAPDGRRVLVSQPIQITPAVATITAPEAVETGTQFPVEFTGPAGAGDYLDLVPAGNTDTGGGELSYFYVESASDGKSGTLTAPDKAGNYDIRYVLEAAGGRRIVTRVPITVQ